MRRSVGRWTQVGEPLCHLTPTRPIFRSEDGEQYRDVNRGFSESVCQDVDSDDAIILVQDYHFALET